MLYYKNDKWHFCPYLVTYIKDGQQTVKYTESKQWWEDFAAKWSHTTIYAFDDVIPTSEQQARLDEVNSAGIPEGFKAGACQFVETGELPIDDDGNALSQFDGLSGEVTPPLGMSISLDKTVVTADGTDAVTATVQLKRGESLTDEQDGTAWYVPVLGIDGVQYDLLKFTISSGEATVPWDTSKKGIYKIRIDMIRPTTNIRLPGNIEIIAE